MDTIRSEDVRAGVRIEIFTIAWMVVEMAVSIGAGIAAGSVLLVAFGLDSLIELVSGGMLLWRLGVESRGGDVERVERAEQRAERVVAVTLTLLCVYVLVSAVYGLIAHTTPENSPLGIGVSAGGGAGHAVPGAGQTPHCRAHPQRGPGRGRGQFDHLRLYGGYGPGRVWCYSPCSAGGGWIRRRRWFSWSGWGARRGRRGKR